MTYLSQKGIGRRLPTLTKRGRQRLRLAEDRVDDTQKRSSLCKTQEHADVAKARAKVRPLPRYTFSKDSPWTARRTEARGADPTIATKKTRTSKQAGRGTKAVRRVGA